MKFEVIDFNLKAIVLSEKKGRTFPIWDYDNGELLLPVEKSNIEEILNAILNDYIQFMDKKNKEDW